MSETVGIVIVSHSLDIAKGTADMASRGVAASSWNGPMRSLPR